MKKQELLERILGHYSEEEWEDLRKETEAAPVSAANRKAMSDFKVAARELDASLRQRLGDLMILSNESCDRCARCTYPDSPCRFPDTLHHAIEGYGFNVLELTRQG